MIARVCVAFFPLGIGIALLVLASGAYLLCNLPTPVDILEEDVREIRVSVTSGKLVEPY